MGLIDRFTKMFTSERKERRQVSRRVWYIKRRGAVARAIDLVGAGLLLTGVALFSVRVAFVVGGLVVITATWVFLEDGE